MIDDACLRADGGNDHRMPGRRLAKLPVEEQIARLCGAYVAADEEGIALDKCFGVSELSEAAVGEVSGVKAAGLDAEELRTERRIRIMPYTDFAGECVNFNACREEPGIVMPLEGFAVRVAQQAGAIGNLGWDLRGR